MVLPSASFIRQIPAQFPLAVALVSLGIQDFGPAHQDVDLLPQIVLGPEHAFVAHGLALGGMGLHLGAIQRHMAQAHHPRLRAQPEHLNKQTLEGIEVATAELTDPAADRPSAPEARSSQQAHAISCLRHAGLWPGQRQETMPTP
jgi:hypothetical protein